MKFHTLEALDVEVLKQQVRMSMMFNDFRLWGQDGVRMEIHVGLWTTYATMANESHKRNETKLQTCPKSQSWHLDTGYSRNLTYIFSE